MSNQIREAFDSIKADEVLLASTRKFLQAERRRRERNRLPRVVMQPLLATACLVFLLLISAGGYRVVQTPVSYVSIDINPSITLSLNRFDRVVAAEAYNDEGGAILEDVAVNGKPYTEAIELLLQEEAMGAYLTEEALLTFAVASVQDTKQQQLLATLKSSESSRHYESCCLSTDWEAVAAARDSGLSLGKYQVYQELFQYDHNLTTEQCQEMSMRQLHHLLSEHENHEHGKQGSQNGIGWTEQPTEQRGHHGNGHH